MNNNITSITTVTTSLPSGALAGSAVTTEISPAVPQGTSITTTVNGPSSPTVAVSSASVPAPSRALSILAAKLSAITKANAIKPFVTGTKTVNISCFESLTDALRSSKSDLAIVAANELLHRVGDGRRFDVAGGIQTPVKDLPKGSVIVLLGNNNSHNYQIGKLAIVTDPGIGALSRRAPGKRLTRGNTYGGQQYRTATEAEVLEFVSGFGPNDNAAVALNLPAIYAAAMAESMR